MVGSGVSWMEVLSHPHRYRSWTYLARYSHRIALTDGRIVNRDGDRESGMEDRMVAPGVGAVLYGQVQMREDLGKRPSALTAPSYSK